MFLTSFFGGPAAAVAIIAVGSQRLRRLTRDWPWLLLMLVVTLTLVGWVRSSQVAAGFRDWLSQAAGASGATLLYRALALLCFAAGYWMHGKAHRNSDLLGLKRPNGWLVGICCGLAGFAFTAIAAAVAAKWGVNL